MKQFIALASMALLAACSNKPAQTYHYRQQPGIPAPAVLSEGRVDAGFKNIVGAMTGENHHYRIKVEKIGNLPTNDSFARDLRSYSITPGPQNVFASLGGKYIPFQFSAISGERYQFAGQAVSHERFRLLLLNSQRQVVASHDFFNNGQSRLNPVMEMTFE